VSNSVSSGVSGTVSSVGAWGLERRPRLDWVFAVLLSAASMLPFLTTFQGLDWLALTGGGIVAVVATVAALSRTAWGLILTPVALVGIYLVIAIPTTSPRHGLGAMLPTGDSLGLVTRATTRCWGDLIGTLPLVDSDGPPLLVPLILGLGAATGAAVLVAVSEHPVLPVLPPLVALALAMAMGRGDLSQVPVGVVFAVLALLWAGHRVARDRGGRSTLARSQMAAVLAMALLAGAGGAALATATADSVEPHVFRETRALGMDTASMPSLLEGFRRYRPQGLDAVDNVVDKRLLTVEGGPEDLRLRFAVLDVYDGVTWRPNPDRSPADSTARYLRVGAVLDNPSSGPTVDVRVLVHDGWRSNWVPTAGALQEIAFDFQRERADRREDLRYNLATSAALLPTFLRGGDDYYFQARLPDDELTDDLGVGPDLNPELYAKAAFVEPITSRYLQRYGEPLKALLALARRLRQEGRYSDGAVGFETKFQPGHGLERLGPLFLFAPQIVGNDEQYAALMALMANRLGIPARVVVGAVTPASGVIMGQDVHAWIEVQVSDGSWRTLESEKFIGTRKPDPEVDRKRKPPSEVLVSPRDQQQQPQQPAEERSPQRRFPKPTVVVDEPSWTDHWPWLLLLLPLTVPGAKLVRRRRRRGADRPADAIAGGWSELVDRGRDLGVPVLAGATRSQQAATLGHGAGLAGLADSHVFGAAEATIDEAAEFWDLVSREASELDRDHVWWRRAVAWFSPRSLLTPGGRRTTRPAGRRQSRWATYTQSPRRSHWSWRGARKRRGRS